MTHREAIEKNGSIIVSPVSGSMRPMIRENVDSARFVSTKTRKPKRGDVVLYTGYGRNEGKTVMHRIIGIDPDHYIIKGDRSCGKEKVPKEEVFGIMTGYFRGSRYRSAGNPVFRIYAFGLTFPHRFLTAYRNSDSLLFKGARFAWRKVLHHGS